jgi:hypothetical protein
MKKFLFILIFSGSILPAASQKRSTEVRIKGEDFYINGAITLKGKTYNGMRLEGLLPNSRMVQGVFDDYNAQTQSFWVYPDTKRWDADRNTDEFIAAMAAWKDHGLLAFTLNLQGGSPFGYSANQQTWRKIYDSPDAYFKSRRRVGYGCNTRLFLFWTRSEPKR